MSRDIPRKKPTNRVKPEIFRLLLTENRMFSPPKTVSPIIYMHKSGFGTALGKNMSVCKINTR